MRVLVAGATGNVGTELVPLLQAAGHHVRTLSRHPAGGDHVVADVTDPSAVTVAVADVDAAFLAAPIPVLAAAARSLAGAAAAAGVPRFVLLASAIVEVGADDPVSAAHREAEAAAAVVDIEVTVLRPGSFATNALGWASHVRDRTPVPLILPHRPIAPIDPADIARVAHLALESAAPPICTLSGPVATSGAGMVDAIAEATGLPLTWVEVPLPDDPALRAKYHPDAPWATSSALVEQLTDHPASSFRDWCLRNAGRFA